jgi:hypothetical protein
MSVRAKRPFPMPSPAARAAVLVLTDGKGRFDEDILIYLVADEKNSNYGSQNRQKGGSRRKEGLMADITAIQSVGSVIILYRQNETKFLGDNENY